MKGVISNVYIYINHREKEKKKKKKEGKYLIQLLLLNERLLLGGDIARSKGGGRPISIHQPLIRFFLFPSRMSGVFFFFLSKSAG